MKKVFSLGTLLVLAMFVTGCHKGLKRDIRNINGRLDQIENVEIKSINQQITQINSSIPKLEQTDKELRGYIDALQKSAGDLKTTIEEIDGKIKTLKEELSSSNAEILSKLESVKSDLEGRLDKINQTIATLKSKDTELEGKINDLKSYVDEKDFGTRDWALTTFATIDQYNAVVQNISSIQKSIESLNSSVETLEKDLKEG